MADLVPEYLTYDYRCTFRGFPGCAMTGTTTRCS